MEPTDLKRIITVTGYKGGVGKSTTAFHLAAYFSVLGKTLLVDGDRNRSCKNWGGRAPSPLGFTICDERQGYQQVTAHTFIIIDTPAQPATGDLKELAEGCDLLILPTAPDVLSLEPMLEITQDLQQFGANRYRALITIVPPAPSKEGHLMMADLREAGMPVFSSMIRRTVNFPKAALAGIPVRDLDGTRGVPAWEDYSQLGREVEEVLHGR